jgi:hypothetical protein
MTYGIGGNSGNNYNLSNVSTGNYVSSACDCIKGTNLCVIGNAAGQLRIVNHITLMEENKYDFAGLTNSIKFLKSIRVKFNFN